MRGDLRVAGALLENRIGIDDPDRAPAADARQAGEVPLDRLAPRAPQRVEELAERLPGRTRVLRLIGP